jgi:initiation factor 1A
MVKNSIGGNKAKKQGRKHIVASSAPTRLRIATEEGELYGCVLKIYGNGMCQVLGIDGKEYLCHIRNKFRGRSKRDNMITMGSWVLVGLREWETGIKRSCDLLELYGQHEIEQLKIRVYNVNWTILGSGAAAAAAGGGGGNEYKTVPDDIEFVEREEEEEEFTATAATASGAPTTRMTIYTCDELVDIDDI